MVTLRADDGDAQRTAINGCSILGGMRTKVWTAAAKASSASAVSRTSTWCSGTPGLQSVRDCVAKKARRQPPSLARGTRLARGATHEQGRELLGPADDEQRRRVIVLLVDRCQDVSQALDVFLISGRPVVKEAVSAHRPPGALAPGRNSRRWGATLEDDEGNLLRASHGGRLADPELDAPAADAVRVMATLFDPELGGEPGAGFGCRPERHSREEDVKSDRWWRPVGRCVLHIGSKDREMVKQRVEEGRMLPEGSSRFAELGERGRRQCCGPGRHVEAERRTSAIWLSVSL